MTHEVRVSSTDAGAFQWQAGVFYSNIKRDYSQRVPTPGYDSYLEELLRPKAFARELIAGGRSFNEIQWISVIELAVRLRSDVRSQADGGIRRGDLHALRPPRVDRRVALVRLGRRQDLQIGWDLLKSRDAQNQNVTVSSNGLTPRFMVSYDVTDRVAVNAQASQGISSGRRERSVEPTAVWG